MMTMTKPHYTAEEFETLTHLMNLMEASLTHKKHYCIDGSSPKTFDQLIRAIENETLCSRQQWLEVTQDQPTETGIQPDNNKAKGDTHAKTTYQVIHQFIHQSGGFTGQGPA